MSKPLGLQIIGVAAATTTATSDKANQHGGCEYRPEYEQGRFGWGVFHGVLLYKLVQRRGHQSRLTARAQKQGAIASTQWSTLWAVYAKHLHKMRFWGRLLRFCNLEVPQT